MQHSMMQPASAGPSLASLQQQPTGGQLRALIETKQHELAVIHDFQSRSLASDNATLSQALTLAQQRYEQLKNDFAYNLELLSARDQELARYDALSVEYAKTLANKSDESSERARQLEYRLEARSMELANAEETATALRARVSALEESLAAATWNAESERRAIESNAQRSIKDLEAKLRSASESQSKTQYELLFNFERGVAEKTAEAQRAQENLERDVRMLKSDLEKAREDTRRTEDKLKLESHRRQTLEQRLQETDEKLLQAESNANEIKTQLLKEKNDRALAEQELNSSHEAILATAIKDYKSLVGQVEKMQAAALAQTTAHEEALAKARRDMDKQANDIAQNYTQRIHALETDLQLTTQQLSDSRVLVQSVTAELNGIVAADASRSSTLQSHLSEFQTNHATQVQALNESLWKAEEEKKALADSKAQLKKTVEERRAEIATLKEKLALQQGRLEEMERTATTARLKNDRDLEDKEEEAASLRAQIKAGQESLKSVQVALESQIARAANQQALAEEYEKQLRTAREELMALARGEEEQLERRLATGGNGVDPVVQQQLQQMGAELNNMSSHLRAGGKGLPPPHPSSHMLSIPSSARSLAQQQRSGNTTPPDGAHRRVGSRDGQRGGVGSSHAQHSPRPYTPAFSDDMGPASLPASMPNSPLPVKSILKPSTGDAAAAAGGGGRASEPSPSRVIVEGPLLSVMTDSHSPLEVETAAPRGRKGSLKAARKQSITSPNINLNAGQSSLEEMHVPPSIQEHKEARGSGGRGLHSSGSEADFVEQVMEDSSDNDAGSGGGRQRGGGGHSAQHRVVMPLQISHEDGMDGMQVELVEDEQQQPQRRDSRNLSPRSERASSHDDSTSSAADDADRTVRRLRKENSLLSTQNQGLSTIIRQMKRELEQLMLEQAQQAANQAAAKSAAESQRVASLEAALAAKSKELTDLQNAPQPPLHPFYAPQFPPPPSTYQQSPLGYGPIPPIYPPFHPGSSPVLSQHHPAVSSFEAAHDLQQGQAYLLKTAAEKERERRERERREEEAAGAAAAKAAAEEFDRRYEEHKENAAAAAASTSRTHHTASARIRRSSPTGHGGYDDADIELSLHGTGVLAHVSGGGASGRRDVAFHSSERATDSQRESARALRVRAEIHRRKDENIKARADAARAKVREQMRRNKSVERERQRAPEDLDA